MLVGLRQRLTFANVVSLIALFVALGGTSIAAVSLNRNSVKARHIAPNSVTSPKVKDQSLFAQDFAPGQLPAGPQGERGLQGVEGPSGLPGQNGRDGKDGLDGTDGVDGTDGQDGQSFVWQGPWDAETTYVPRDAVSFQGSSYTATAENQGEEPSADKPGEGPWQLMASKGDQGAPGTSGYQIVQGFSDFGVFETHLSATASCPGGKKALGGGAAAEEGATTSGVLDADNYDLRVSRPTAGGTGWYAEMHQEAPLSGGMDGWNVRVFAICATVSP